MQDLLYFKDNTVWPQYLIDACLDYWGYSNENRVILQWYCCTGSRGGEEWDNFYADNLRPYEDDFLFGWKPSKKGKGYRWAVIPKSLWVEYLEMKKNTPMKPKQFFSKKSETFSRQFNKIRHLIHPDFTKKVPTMKMEKGFFKMGYEYKYQIHHLRKNYETHLLKYFMAKLGCSFDEASNMVSREMCHSSTKIDRYYYLSFKEILNKKNAAIHPMEQIKRDIQIKLCAVT